MSLKSFFNRFPSQIILILLSFGCKENNLEKNSNIVTYQNKSENSEVTKRLPSYLKNKELSIFIKSFYSIDLELVPFLFRKNEDELKSGSLDCVERYYREKEGELIEKNVYNCKITLKKGVKEVNDFLLCQTLFDSESMFKHKLITTYEITFADTENFVIENSYFESWLFKDFETDKIGILEVRIDKFRNSNVSIYREAVTFPKSFESYNSF